MLAFFNLYSFAYDERVAVPFHLAYLRPVIETHVRNGEYCQQTCEEVYALVVKDGYARYVLCRIRWYVYHLLLSSAVTCREIEREKAL